MPFARQVAACRILGEIDDAAEMDIEELEQQAKAVKQGSTNSGGGDHGGDGA